MSSRLYCTNIKLCGKRISKVLTRLSKCTCWFVPFLFTCIISGFLTLIPSILVVNVSFANHINLTKGQEKQPFDIYIISFLSISFMYHNLDVQNNSISKL